MFALQVALLLPAAFGLYPSAGAPDPSTWASNNQAHAKHIQAHSGKEEHEAPAAAHEKSNVSPVAARLRAPQVEIHDEPPALIPRPTAKKEAATTVNATEKKRYVLYAVEDPEAAKKAAVVRRSTQQVAPEPSMSDVTDKYHALLRQKGLEKQVRSNSSAFKQTPEDEAAIQASPFAPVINELRGILEHSEEVLKHDGEDRLAFCKNASATLENVKLTYEYANVEPHAWAINEASTEIEWLCINWQPSELGNLQTHLHMMEEVMTLYLERLACAPGDVPCGEGGHVNGFKPECSCVCHSGYSGDTCEIGPPQTTVVTIRTCSTSTAVPNISPDVLMNSIYQLNLHDPSDSSERTPGKLDEYEIVHFGPLESLRLRAPYGQNSAWQICSISVEGHFDWTGRIWMSDSCGSRGDEYAGMINCYNDLDVLHTLTNANIVFKTCPNNGGPGQTADSYGSFSGSVNGQPWVQLNMGQPMYMGATSTTTLNHPNAPISSLTVNANGNDAWEICAMRVDGLEWTGRLYLDNPCEAPSFLQVESKTEHLKIPSRAELKEACYAESGPNKNCTAVLAEAIVGHAEKCYKKHPERTNYVSCTSEFCFSECGEAEGCSELCDEKTSDAYEVFSKSPTALLEVGSHTKEVATVRRTLDVLRNLEVASHKKEVKTIRNLDHTLSGKGPPPAPYYPPPVYYPPPPPPPVPVDPYGGYPCVRSFNMMSYVN